jgi:hypothetical protein
VPDSFAKVASVCLGIFGKSQMISPISIIEHSNIHEMIRVPTIEVPGTRLSMKLRSLEIALSGTVWEWGSTLASNTTWGEVTRFWLVWHPSSILGLLVGVGGVCVFA